MREHMSNPEIRAKTNQQVRQRYANNPEPFKQSSNRWHRENPEKAVAATRAWRENNRGRSRISSNRAVTKWNAVHPEKRRRNRQVSKSLYRARKLAAPGHFSPTDLIALDIKQGGICALCGTSYDGVYSVDHIVPLALVGINPRATNWPDNLQLTHMRCNAAKNAKFSE
jgi:5-methylcytosine-specific restriction endonuclease McrA